MIFHVNITALSKEDGCYLVTDNGNWRDISPEEVAMVRAIISTSGISEGQALLDDLPGAVVLQDVVWIYDVKTPNTAPGTSLPNGPYPVRAYVPSAAAYRGEILIWITDGHLSALEYAWVTDDPPTRWPRPDEMEIVAWQGDCT
jgi:hypothetical protein